MKKFALALMCAVSLAGCSSQSVQSGLEPKISSCPPTNNTLQFLVGTANVAGTLGLNTLVALRQNAGDNCSAGASLLVDAPTITAPAGFVTGTIAGAGNTDAGTSTIVGNIVTSLASPPPSTTFDNAVTGNGLASAYGFLPAIQTNSLAGPSFSPYGLPFYSTTQLTYIGGPPAFVPPTDSGGVHTSTRDGTFPPGYLGYVLGFVDFASTPVAGSYSLSVVIPTGISTSTGASTYTTETKAASITSVAGLSSWATAPTFASDGAGGGTITTNFAGGAGLTEEYIEAVDFGPGGTPSVPAGVSGCTTSPLTVSYPIYYTFKVTPGTATVAVPDDIGPAQPGKTPGHTFCTAADNTTAAGATAPGDSVELYGFAVDYGLFASAFPQSDGNPAPTIATGATGQADVTTSPANATGTE